MPYPSFGVPCRPSRSVLITFGAVLLFARAASAQGAGFQGGVSVDPDQVYVGSHFEAGPLVGSLYLRPSVDAGFGDDIKLAMLNIELIFKYPLRNSAWTIYQGSGPAVVFVRVNDTTDTRGGVNFLLGFAHRGGFFTEFKVGGSSSPTLKFGVGYTFR